MLNYDCVIIGNGSIGLACAYELSNNAEKKFKIALFGKKNREGSASLAAGAMINVFGELEYDTLSSGEGKSKFQMLLKSRVLWKEHIDKLNNETSTKLKFYKGTYVLNNSSADDLDDKNFNSIEKGLKYFKEPYSFVNGKDIKGYYPEPKSRSLNSLYIPNEGFISSAKNLLDAYDKIFDQKKNIDIKNSDIKKIIIKKDLKILIDDKGNKYSCKNLVIAAGSYSNFLIKQIKQIKNKIPDIFFGIGNAIIAESDKQILPDKVVRTPNRGMACGLHVVPLNKKNIYIGASNRVMDRPNKNALISTTSNLMNSLLKEVNQNYGNLKIKKICTGYRPTTSDTFPIIGETSVKGLYIISGTKRDGLSLSLLLSKYITNSILKLKNGYKFPKVFKPERKLISTMTIKEGIEKSVKHRISAAFQHELSIPKTESLEDYKNMIYSEVLKIYKNEKLKKGVSPEILNLYKYKKILNK